MKTLTEILDRHDVAVADELLADLVIPVLAGMQRQGDVLIVPRPLTDAERADCQPVPPTGIAVVIGEATGNTHMLDADGPVFFARRSGGVQIGAVDVPEGSVAYLVHTDEHGANAMAPGTYALHGKREQAEDIPCRGLTVCCGLGMHGD